MSRSPYWRRVIAVGISSTFIRRGEEPRPRNFLIPQLTYAADHPGEDLPRFRFAFEVTDE